MVRESKQKPVQKTTKKAKVQKPPKVKKGVKVQMQKISKQTLRLRIHKHQKDYPSTKYQNFLKNHNAILESSILNEENFNCPICLQFMVYPSLMECGHSFCLKCVEQASKINSSCSVCRASQQISEVQPSNFISQIIEKTFLIDEEKQKYYQQRKLAFQIEDQSRKFGDYFHIGDKLDFFDRTNVWQEGKIKQIKINKKKEVVLSIKPINSGLSVEEIKLTSRRIAKHHFFTKSCPIQTILRQRIRIMTTEAIIINDEDLDSLPLNPFNRQNNIQIFQNHTNNSELLFHLDESQLLAGWDDIFE